MMLHFGEPTFWEISEEYTCMLILRAGGNSPSPTPGCKGAYVSLCLPPPPSPTTMAKGTQSCPWFREKYPALGEANRTGGHWRRCVKRDAGPRTQKPQVTQSCFFLHWEGSFYSAPHSHRTAQAYLVPQIGWLGRPKTECSDRAANYRLLTLPSPWGQPCWAP